MFEDNADGSIAVRAVTEEENQKYLAMREKNCERKRSVKNWHSQGSGIQNLPNKEYQNVIRGTLGLPRTAAGSLSGKLKAHAQSLGINFEVESEEEGYEGEDGDLRTNSGTQGSTQPRTGAENTVTSTFTLAHSTEQASGESTSAGFGFYTNTPNRSMGIGNLVSGGLNLSPPEQTTTQPPFLENPMTWPPIDTKRQKNVRFMDDVSTGYENDQSKRFRGVGVTSNQSLQFSQYKDGSSQDEIDHQLIRPNSPISPEFLQPMPIVQPIPMSYSTQFSASSMLDSTFVTNSASPLTPPSSASIPVARNENVFSSFDLSVGGPSMPSQLWSTCSGLPEEWHEAVGPKPTNNNIFPLEGLFDDLNIGGKTPWTFESAAMQILFPKSGVPRLPSYNVLENGRGLNFIGSCIQEGVFYVKTQTPLNTAVTAQDWEVPATVWERMEFSIPNFNEKAEGGKTLNRKTRQTAKWAANQITRFTPLRSVEDIMVDIKNEDPTVNPRIVELLRVCRRSFGLVGQKVINGGWIARRGSGENGAPTGYCFLSVARDMAKEY